MNEKEKEAFDEEYNRFMNETVEKVKDCGVFSIELPQDLFVLLRTPVGYEYEDSKEVVYVFCNKDYAKLYCEWCEQKAPGKYIYDIQQTKGNPPKETIENYV